MHNYQRYPVSVGDPTIQYIVSGGGAYMHPTHKIPNIDRCNLPGVTEDQFRCYPLRGDSLSLYSQLYDIKLPGPWRIGPETRRRTWRGGSAYRRPNPTWPITS